MIVDCHTHVQALDKTAVSEHLAAAETVDACIVLASPDESRDQVNGILADYVGQYKDRMVGFAVMDPTEDPINDKSLAALTQKLGLKGVVVYCSLSGFHPTHSRAMRFYGAVQEIGLPIFFHNGGHTLSSEAVLEYAQPYLLDEVARTFPELRIVVGNMGVPFFEQTLSLIAKHERVFADLTIRPGNLWQTYNIVVAAHERGVVDKLLFGSGFPVSSAGECIETLLGFNMLLADTKLPTVPRASIRNVIERDSLALLGIAHEQTSQPEHKTQAVVQQKQDK
jgi:predicted TIM-barrel fold metal-dependent hydrolase